MKRSKKGNYILLSDIASIDVLGSELSKNASFYQGFSVIADLENKILDQNDIEKLEKVFYAYKETGMSFVARVAKYNPSKFSDDFNIAPTIEEAEDIIKMENLERELGF